MSLIRKFKSDLPPWLLRFFANMWLPLLGAGIRVKQISPDFRDITVQLKLHWYNSNYVGTHFGGSMFAMTDPFFMLMLIKNLGDNYIVWDKAASINFIKPGRSTLTTRFVLTQEIIDTVLEKTAGGDKYIFDLPLDVIDAEGVVVAAVVRTLYVRKKLAVIPAVVTPPVTP